MGFCDVSDALVILLAFNVSIDFENDLIFLHSTAISVFHFIDV